MATEAQAQDILQKVSQKMHEVDHASRQLEEAKVMLGKTRKRSDIIGEAIRSLRKRRRLVETHYVMILKKDERLHNGTRSWKPQEPGQPEIDHSYIREESDDQDTSDFVESSDVSLQGCDSMDESDDSARYREVDGNDEDSSD
ncbi:hypothetical protein BDY19DRAFT_943609 [Irpex rosettiformis]|uniref:Uncharacterized protein n=1 Tax=Irpex rosettiformis TaxID=378272 RepID=A0ACB8U5R6_9APHY|nr:hypothetical protein BDY19DRAFT_943609 [Irpex rosettiformis]